MPAAYPQLRLDRPALEANIALMAAWCAERDVRLAPHVKTTMSAPVIARQVEAGAGPLTVATLDQAAVLIGWGHRDLLVANEVVDPYGLTRLRGWLEADPGLRIRVFVDSSAGLDAASRVFGTGPVALEVLVDVGTPGGRTGVRTPEAAYALARAVVAAPGVRLVGVAGYEAVVGTSRDPDVLALVDAHCNRVRDVFLGLAGAFETDAPVFSMGGSAFPDRVVAAMPDRDAVPGSVRLLRSGCYVTHDHGMYAAVSPIPGLRPALTVRALVLSTPEPGTAVLNAGKRDLPYDAGLPTLLRAWTAAGEDRAEASGRLVSLYDQHAVVRDAVGLAVGDVVELGLSHPCSAFDRWPAYVAGGSDGPDEIWTTDFGRTSITG